MRVSGIPYVQGRNSYSDPDGTKFGIAIHNTSNNASAEAEASYATRRTDGVSSHFYCDADSVVQSLDTAAKAGHAGSGNGNNHAVAVEITGTNDKSREWWLRSVAWDLLGQVLAQVCRAYGVEVRRASVEEMKRNPKVRAFYGHDDMRRAWGGTTHTDPGPNFPWDRLFQAVNDALGVAPKPTSKEDTDMPFVAHDEASGQFYVCDLITSRPVELGDVDDVIHLAQQMGYPHGPGDDAEWSHGGWVRRGWTEDRFGAVLKPAGVVTVEVGGDDLAAALATALDSPGAQAALVRAVNAAEDS